MKIFEGRYGSVEYKLFPGDDKKPPIFVVPGFPLGTTQLDNFAATLSRLGDRTVIAPDAVRLEGPKVATLEKEADLYLGIIEEGEKLGNTDLQVVTHAYGAAVFQKMMEKAAAKGLECFKGEKSRVVMVAPVGTTADSGPIVESLKLDSAVELVKLARGFGHFLLKSLPSGKVFDPDMKLLKENLAVIAKHPRKTAGEIRAIVKARLDAKNLGEVASRTSLIDYPEDPLFGMRAKTVSRGLQGQMDHIAGISTPVKIEPGLGMTQEAFNQAFYKEVSRQIVAVEPFMSQEAFKQIMKDELRRRYFHASHTARHDALIGNPEPTANAVLDLLEDDRLMKRVQQGHLLYVSPEHRYRWANKVQIKKDKELKEAAQAAQAAGGSKI